LSAAASDEAVTTHRHAQQRPGRPLRGKTTTPAESQAAIACEGELRRAGAKGATLKVIAPSQVSPQTS